jgi:hypothetical protein
VSSSSEVGVAVGVAIVDHGSSRRALARQFTERRRRARGGSANSMPSPRRRCAKPAAACGRAGHQRPQPLGRRVHDEQGRRRRRPAARTGAGGRRRQGGPGRAVHALRAVQRHCRVTCSPGPSEHESRAPGADGAGAGGPPATPPVADHCDLEDDVVALDDTDSGKARRRCRPPPRAEPEPEEHRDRERQAEQRQLGSVGRRAAAGAVAARSPQRR